MKTQNSLILIKLVKSWGRECKREVRRWAEVAQPLANEDVTTENMAQGCPNSACQSMPSLNSQALFLNLFTYYSITILLMVNFIEVSYIFRTFCLV
jgi:hypothetical protein